jgi:hypothetical protein
MKRQSPHHQLVRLKTPPGQARHPHAPQHEGHEHAQVDDEQAARRLLGSETRQARHPGPGPQCLHSDHAAIGEEPDWRTADEHRVQEHVAVALRGGAS